MKEVFFTNYKFANFTVIAITIANIIIKPDYFV